VADHRLPASDPVGNESQQRASDHPAERDRGGDPDRVLVLAPSSFLQEAHAPRHVEDRRRHEEQAGDQTAQDRLRIRKDGLQRRENAAGAGRAGRGPAL